MSTQEMEDPFAITKPDWPKWLEVKSVKLWQAVALACNYDPSNFKFFDDKTFNGEILCPFSRRPSDFSELLKMAKSNLGGKLKVLTINKTALEESEVSFPAFFSWLKATGYELPTELLGSVNNKAIPLIEETPLKERERTTLLTLIAALAKEAGIDITKPSKAAGLIEDLTLQIDRRVSARAIENHLKKIPAALEKGAS